VRGHRRALLAAPLLLLSSTAALAQDDVSKARTQAHVDLGAEFFRAGRYEAAIEEFLKANEIISLPDYAYYIARCHDELGHAGRALAYYESFLARAEDNERATKARKAARALRAKLAGTVIVRCQPPAAFVEVRGVGTGGCPFEREGVRPGTYQVAVRAPGFLPGIEELRVVAGGRAETTVTLRERPVPAAAASDPKGPSASQAPTGPEALPETDRPPETPAGPPRSPPVAAPAAVDPPPAGGPTVWPPSLWSLVPMGLAAGSFGAGLWFGGKARSAELQLDECIRDDVPTHCATSPTVQGQLSERVSNRALQANVAYAAAVVGLGISVWLWLSVAVGEERQQPGEEPQQPKDDGWSGAIPWPVGVRWTF